MGEADPARGELRPGGVTELTDHQGEGELGDHAAQFVVAVPHAVGDRHLVAALPRGEQGVAAHQVQVRGGPGQSLADGGGAAQQVVQHVEQPGPVVGRGQQSGVLASGTGQHRAPQPVRAGRRDPGGLRRAQHGRYPRGPYQPFRLAPAAGGGGGDEPRYDDGFGEPRRGRDRGRGSRVGWRTGGGRLRHSGLRRSAFVPAAAHGRSVGGRSRSLRGMWRVTSPPWRDPSSPRRRVRYMIAILVPRAPRCPSGGCRACGGEPVRADQPPAPTPAEPPAAVSPFAVTAPLRPGRPSRFPAIPPGPASACARC